MSGPNLFVFRLLVCDEKGVYYLAKRLLSQGGYSIWGGIVFGGGTLIGGGGLYLCTKCEFPFHFVISRL